VRALKYGGRHRTAQGLARRLLLEAPVRSLVEKTDALVPVPLFWTREADRGFNQADLIADAIRLETGRPVFRLLRRFRETETQTRLHRDERRSNVQGAFLVGEHRDVKRVTLVDDVVTTGATLEACASVLLRTGVSEVFAITVARAE
jgi:ComF family protein